MLSKVVSSSIFKVFGMTRQWLPICLSKVYKYYLYIYWYMCMIPIYMIGVMLETWVQLPVESYRRLKKWYLMQPCLNLSIIRIMINWCHLGKGILPSLISWCSSYRKGCLWVTFDYVRQLYFIIDKCIW